MENNKILQKEVCGNSFSVLSTEGGSAIFDTVPAEFPEWLECAPDADTLILCRDNPYPNCVEYFLSRRPGGVVIATPYVIYTLKGILGKDFPCREIRQGMTASVGGVEIKFGTVTQPGVPAYMTADAGEAGFVSGYEPDPLLGIEPSDSPTAIVVYDSGFDYTENMALTISKGISDTRGISVELYDLESTDTLTVMKKLAASTGFLIGTPTTKADASPKVWDLLTKMKPERFQGIYASAFGSCKASPDGVDTVIHRLKSLKLIVPDTGFSIQYKPDKASLKGAYEFGYSFGCTIQKKPNTHRSRLVKCLVCGAIFDSSLGVCPVCGAGMDKCVPVEDEVINYKADTDLNYVIIGGGTAGLTAAEAIRNRDGTGNITLVTAENTVPINRPMLTKNMVIAAKVPGSLEINSAGWYRGKRIKLMTGLSAKSLDTTAKTVSLSDGSVIPYDKLIYAAGAECFVPPFTGTDLDGVFTLRHLEDAENIWSRVTAARNAVVIGGGVLGLETAAELKKARLSVTVLEMAPKIMSRQLDDETGDRLVAAAAKYGVKVLTGVNIKGLTGDGKVTGVETDDGTVYPADIVVMSCGNRANIGPAAEAGIECGRAIKVNRKMETSCPDVYACGDCAELDGVNFQLWSEASEQGRIAGANAMGSSEVFESVPYGTSFDTMNTSLFSIGDLGKGGKDYKVLEYRDEILGHYRKYWFVNDILCGGILYGDTSLMQTLTDAVTAGSSYSDLAGKL